MSSHQYLNDESFDRTLRLGDIIAGFSYFIPEFHDFDGFAGEFKIDVKRIRFGF